MKLSIANPKDQLLSQKLSEFFKNFTLDGHVRLCIDRRDSFFSSYQWQSEKFRTYLLEDPEGVIQGCASFLFRETQDDSHIANIAYSQDLRISNNRETILNWTKHFLPVLEEVSKDFNTKTVFTYINHTDVNALNTFVRPRSLKRPLPRFHLYRKVNLVSLHGLTWWANSPISGLKIIKGSAEIKSDLIQYISKKSQYKTFSSVWDKASFDLKMQAQAGLKIEDFFVAINHKDQIVGCLNTWNPSNRPNYIPLSYNLEGHNFRQLLKILWFFGMTRRLTKPYSRTGKSERLSFNYVSQIHVDNEDIFESLLYYAFHSTPKDTFLVYAHCDQDYRLRPPESWISASQAYALYSIIPPGQSLPDFLSPHISLNPEVEAYHIL